MATSRGRGDWLDKIGFTLDALTDKLYGPDIAYEKPWGETDAGLLAIEIHDFAGAILDKRPPEVDGWGGLTAVASVLAAYESGLSGKAVTMDDVIEGRVSAFSSGRYRCGTRAVARPVGLERGVRVSENDRSPRQSSTPSRSS